MKKWSVFCEVSESFLYIWTSEELKTNIINK